MKKHYLTPILCLCIALLVNVLSAANSKPNIIFVMVDDLGYGDLGSYGQKVIQTPRLDQMALEGMRFTQVYAGSPVCAPSRSVLMTGLHTGNTTVRGNFGEFGVVGLVGNPGRVPLYADDVTVAEVLKEAGYTTGLVGKWGLGEPGTTGHPNEQGFDYFFGYLNQRRAHEYYPVFVWENDRMYPLKGNRERQEQDYVHDEFTEKALKFVTKNAQKEDPFFLYLAYTVPHAKYQIPDTAPYTDEPWLADEKVHAAMITRLDRDMGRLFDLLQDKNIDEETIVFFCSDNGAAERWEGRFDSSGILKGRKRDLYEGGIRTPMIVRWPGMVDANQTSDAIWYFADVLPTLAKLGGAKTSTPTDGIDVSPAFLGSNELPERPLYWEFHERGFQQAVRLGDWKGIRLEKGGDLEVFDLSKDPEENKDLAKQYPEIVKKLSELMESERSVSSNWPVE